MEYSSYIKEGKDHKRVIFMIHGILGKPQHFDFLLPYINENDGIYSLLLDGHGGSVLGFAHSSMIKWKKQVEDKFLELSSNYQEVVIVAHSMGGLFAISLALKYKDKITALYLLQPALKIGPKFRLFKDCLKIYFNHVSEADYRAIALKTASSIKIDKQFYHYILWIPRYLELFKEAYAVSKTIDKLKTRTYVYWADDDEMLSRKNAKLFKDNPYVSITHMPKSTHDYYAKADQKLVIKDFKELNK